MNPRRPVLAVATAIVSALFLGNTFGFFVGHAAALASC